MIALKQLQFRDKDVETDFNNWYFPIELRIFRYALLLGIVTYFAFASLDNILYDKALTFQFLVLRISAASIVAIAYGLTFVWIKNPKQYQFFAIILAILCFSANLIFTFFEGVDPFYFYTGDTILIIFIFILLNIRFFNLIFIAIFYILVHLFFLKLNFDYNYQQFMHQVYGIVSIATISLMANWAIEFQKRQNYLNNKLIEEQKEALQKNVIEKDKLLKKLEEQNQELDAFNHSVSHDLKTPLRSINMFSKLLERRYKDKLDENALEYLAFISNGANKMDKLINDLLTYSKIRHQELEYKDIDIKELVEIIFEEQTLHLAIKPILSISNLPNIKGDRVLLAQALNNLISNAIKYSSQNEVSKLIINATQDKENVTYSIQDNGIGFEMKFAKQLFEPFHRLHTDREFKGTGIGLSIVNRIINKHNGKVWAVSEPNEGSTFYFMLPKT
ncbi:MAG: sensor histidine kinase [Saprospiraceae bacterium]